MPFQYWDTRQSTPVAKVDLPERCYTMDVSYPLLVVGTAERHIQMYNLNNPTAVYRVSRSCSDPKLTVCSRQEYAEHGFTPKMADACDILLYHRERICSWKRRRSSRHSVSEMGEAFLSY
jgi:hypothetical protein